MRSRWGLAVVLAGGCVVCQPQAESASRGAPTPSAASSHVRPAVHAGSWYPGDAAGLRKTLEELLTPAGAGSGKADSHPSPVLALVAPHAGLRYSGAVAAAAFSRLRGQKVRRVFLLGPSHQVPFTGVALPAPDLSGYATPLGDLTIDRNAVEALRGKPGFDGPPGAHDREHSLEMEAIFLAAVQPRARLVPLVFGRLPGVALARRVAAELRAVLGAGDVVVVSSDFTHYGPNYGYVPFRDDVPNRLGQLMSEAYAALAQKDAARFVEHLEKTGDTICGREPIRVLLHLLPRDASIQRLASDTSGRMTGSFDNSVGYLAALFRRPGGWGATNGSPIDQGGDMVVPTTEQGRALKMARDTLQAFLRDGKTPEAEALGVPAGAPWHEDYAVFVTLKQHGQLRGCIGHILPIQPLWRDIRENAIAAAVHDPRFPSVTAGDLSSIHIEISVLSRPQAIARPEDFVAGEHGVILEARGRRAVFLPQVAPEQGWDRDTTLNHLARKAGLPTDAWRDSAAELQVFTAQVFAEPES